MLGGRERCYGGASSPSATPISPVFRSATATTGAAASNNAEVLIGGRCRPLVGTVSMDNVTIDLGAEGEAEALRGEPAILIGAQGDERITAEDIARRLGTINYEVTCGLTARVPRVYHRRRRAGSPAAALRAGGVASARMHEALSAARTALAGRPAWLVGGAIRDRLLGRPATDLDVVIDGDPAQAARAIARTAGRAACFALSEEFGAWRVSARDSSWQVDVEPLRGGSLHADLMLRDFTVNAIAEPLAGGASRSTRSGGLEDLSAGRLRMVAPSAFAEDPLRVLRLARIAVELGLHPEPRPWPGARARAAAQRDARPSACSWSCAGSSRRLTCGAASS